MLHMAAGYDSGDKSMLEALAYVSFQELATRISHRNTGRASGCPVAEQLLTRVATDENLHMVFYRNLVDAALDIAPNATMQAIAREVINFQMPGSTMPGFAENALTIAKAGIYDLRSHLEDVCVRYCGSGESSSVTISTAKELARERNWRPFSIWWRPRPPTMTNVAKNDWPERARRPVADR